MPQPYGQAVLTDKGEELLARSSAGHCLIEYVCMAIGDGMYTAEERQRTELKGRTELKREKNRYVFSAATLENNAVRLTALLTNQDPVTAEGMVTEGYYINEVGIYAKEKGTDNSTAILYSICLTASDTGLGDYMPAYAGHNRAEITQDYILHIGDNTNITVNMIGAVALAKDVKECKNEINRHILDNNNPHKVTKVQIGLGEADNTPDRDKPVSAAQQEAIDMAYQQSTAYASQIVNALVNGAPGDLDTIGKLAQAMKDNTDVLDILHTAIGGKADQAELDGHIGNNTIHITASERAKWNAADKQGHTHNNQSVLDAITGAIVDGWNSAVSHISDTVKHITAAERKKWNNGSANYGDCSTAAATAAKTVTCTGFELTAGAEITVKFAVTNTAANPTLNINNTGAKPIYYRGSAITAGYLAANRTYIFRYNGTQWDLVGDINTNTTYSNFVKSGSGAKAGLVPSPGTTAGTTKYLREDGTWATPPDNDTTYADMSPATADAAGKAGLVPAPPAGAQGNFLRADGIWSSPYPIKIEYYTGNTTTTNLMVSLNPPCMCITSTENITDKPFGKYGTIVIFKFSNGRIGAICICTDGTVYHNSWDAASSAVTGWK